MNAISYLPAFAPQEIGSNGGRSERRWQWAERPALLPRAVSPRSLGAISGTLERQAKTMTQRGVAMPKVEAA